MTDALYARQSVEKADSISIESQLAHCRHESRGNPCVEYADRGYSGKNTDRPAFVRLLDDIRAGKISRVIVYKLDRISRSILDFANMIELFERHGVEFISSTERFDTSTPIGRAMLNICIVFAQLERETIQKRVADAYAARAKRGFYMGGRVPYGFTRVETVLGGVRTAMLAPVPEEAAQVRLLYELYADPARSLGEIVSYLNGHGIAHLRGGSWSSARLSELLRSPVYVRADAQVYRFFREQGASVVNPAGDFTGEHGCYLYQSSSVEGRSSLQGCEVVLAPHAGIVPARDWLACRRRCLANRQSTRAHKARNSWLSGKVRCGRCGSALAVVKSDTQWGRYFVCGAAGATKKARCTGVGGTVYAQLLEDYVSGEIAKRLEEWPELSAQDVHQDSHADNARQIQLAEIEGELDALLAKVPQADGVLMGYLNRRAEALDEKRRKLLPVLDAPRSGGRLVLADPSAQWRGLSFEGRQAVADTLIETIRAADGVIEIVWKF